MATRADPSPAARGLRRRGTLAWGIVLVVVWLAVGLPVQVALQPDGVARPAAFGATVLALLVVLAAGIVCLVLGLRGERRCARVDGQDAAVADGVRAAVAELDLRPVDDAYEPDLRMTVISTARLVELEEGVDPGLANLAAAALAERLMDFETTFSAGYAAARAGRVDGPDAIRLSGTVEALSRLRPHLDPVMAADLVEHGTTAVFEAPGGAGDRDTYRVVFPPSRSLRAWLDGLLAAVAQEFGGSRTHAGAAMERAAVGLLARFAPQDGRYARDRLLALRHRPFADRDPSAVVGIEIGRNAVLATQVTIGASDPIGLAPVGFPVLLARALAAGLTR